jgi:hypothetical protein
MKTAESYEPPAKLTNLKRSKILQNMPSVTYVLYHARLQLISSGIPQSIASILVWQYVSHAKQLILSKLFYVLAACREN